MNFRTRNKKKKKGKKRAAKSDLFSHLSVSCEIQFCSAPRWGRLSLFVCVHYYSLPPWSCI